MSSSVRPLTVNFSPSLHGRSWQVLCAVVRVFALAAVAVLVCLLWGNHRLDFGQGSIEPLSLFWRLIVPLVPLLALVVPSFWRNVCPLATLNILGYRLSYAVTHQRSGALSRDSGAIRRAISIWLSRNGLYVASLLLLALVPSRLLVFNESASALAALMVVLCLVAFVAGLVVPFKSGWCSSVCPVHPVEKAYGMSPLLRGENTLCNLMSNGDLNGLQCGGCTRHCFDLKIAPRPEAAGSGAWRPAAGLKLFIGMLPGMVAAYLLIERFLDLTQFALVQKVLVVYGMFLVAIAISSLLYRQLTAVIAEQKRLFQPETKRLDLIYVALAFNLYYLMAAPGVVATAGALLGLSAAIYPLMSAVMLIGTASISALWLRRAW